MEARAVAVPVAVPRVCGKCRDFAGALRVARTILGLVPAFCELPRRDCGGEPLRRQGRRPRVFGLAGFKPAPTKTRASVDSASRFRAAAAHRRACAALTNTMHSAVCAVDAAFAELADTALWCALTFELSGRRRQDARPGLAKMYRVPPGRAWWPAVGGPLERGVRRLLHRFGDTQCLRRGRHGDLL